MKSISPSICITGGAGFIGTNTAAYYLKAGHPVVLLDNLSRPQVKHNLDWLKSIASKNQLNIIIGDVRDPKAIEQAISNQDIIFHFAGQTAVTTSIIDPLNDFSVNAQGTVNVLEAMRLYAKEAVLLYSSTNKVYGELSQVQIKETPTRYELIEPKAIDETTPLDLYTPYGCSKGTGDQYVHDYSRIYGLKTIVFRQSCIYGEHQFGLEDQGWVAHFVSQVIQTRPITIFGNGKQVRDILHIDDLVSAYDLAIKTIKQTAGQIYNLGGGPQHSISLLELINLIQSFTPRPIEVKFLPPRHADQKIYVSNLNKAKHDFGWEPQIGISTGINRLYRWLQHELKLA